MGYAGLRSVPKPYPTGASHPVDADWRARVEQALEKKGWTRKRLAEEIGCDPSAITVVMRPTTVQSRLRVSIDEALDLEGAVLGQLDSELLRALRALDDDSKRHMLALVERMLELRKPTPPG
jgi:hypothetical protein